MRHLRFLLLAILPASLVSAASLCVGPSSSGNGSGSDWNNKAAWSNVSLARNNIYFLEDGSYGSKTLSTANSGTATVTIRKATASDHGVETGWSAAMGDGQAEIKAPLIFTTSYWLLDGKSRTGLRSGHGIKVTNAASPVNQDVTQYGLNNTSAVSNITVSYVEIEGSGTNGDSINDSTVSCFSNSSFNGCTDLKWDHCWIHDAGLVLMFWRQGKRLTVEYSVIERNDSTSANHSEGFVLRGKPTANGGAGDTGDYLIRYNILADIEGTAYIGTPSGPTHHFSNVWVYGNVFITPQTATRGGVGDGVFAVWDCKVFGEAKFYNNTIINFRDTVISGNSSDNSNHNSGFDIGIGYETTHMDELIVRNNLWVDCDSVDDPSDDTTSNMVSYTWSHNAYFATTNTNDSDGNKQSFSTDPLPNWQSGAYTLTSATTGGISLAAPYNADPNGTARGSDGLWDRGAFEFGGTVSGTAPAGTGSTLNAVVR